MRFFRAFLSPSRVISDRSGVTAVEFAIVGPVFIFIVLSIFEIGIAFFIGASIENAMLQSTRLGSTGASAGSSAARMAALKDMIERKTFGLLDMNEVEVDAKVYASFDEIGEPEEYNDDNGNGVYDEGEVFADANGNGQWDEDRGAEGMGGGDEIVLYNVYYDWGLISPWIMSVIGDSIRFKSTVAVRNEPF